ncbi:MAG: hypothetical protein PVH88_04020 [Ignavibacteria bacterium]|jgi:hypothetical protein
MKKTVCILILFTTVFYSQDFKFGQAKGLFMSIGVGPRVPVGKMSKFQNVGSGVNVAFSYTDNEFLPFFVYGKVGFTHFPGRQSLYAETDYSSFSSNIFTGDFGVRFYLPPLVEQVVIIMPVVEAGASLCLFKKFHQFKIGRGKNSYNEDNFNGGFHIGIGVSMFLMEAVAGYNFFNANQFLWFDLKLRIPIYTVI